MIKMLFSDVASPEELLAYYQNAHDLQAAQAVREVMDAFYEGNEQHVKKLYQQNLDWNAFAATSAIKQVLQLLNRQDLLTTQTSNSTKITIFEQVKERYKECWKSQNIIDELKEALENNNDNDIRELIQKANGYNTALPSCAINDILFHVEKEDLLEE